MKLRSLLLGWIIVLMALPSWAQEIDVAQVLADTKTFIFDNGENTVKGYVYAVLENETKCCGDDRIYLEVKIDPSGYVISAKSLTGSNECFTLSAVDIVKNIRWDAAEFKGPKSVYFEIKPNVECNSGRDNEYVAIETFNNEILAPGSTSSGGETSPQVAATEQAPAEADPERLENLINVTSDEEVTEPAEEEAVAVTEEAEPAVEEVEQGAEAVAVVTEEPAPSPAAPQAADPSTSSEPEEVRSTSRSDVAPSEAAEAERVAQQQELQQLRGQLEQLREEEEKRRRELAAREEARRQQEEAERARQETASEEETFASADESAQGGLWLPGGEEEENVAMADEGSTFGGGGMEGMSEEDRLREEVERLRQERIELEQAKRQREQEVMQAIENTRRDNEQILRLEEEIAARQEEAARVREEMELRRLEEERMRMDEARQREEEEYQRMMDEIARLQAEAEAQIANLEAQKAELGRMTELRKKREQEIALERAIREKERKKRMEEVRLGIMSDGIPITSLNEQGQDLQTLMADIDLSAEADSEALQILIQQIQQMKLEMARLQKQIRDLGGEPATPSMGSSSGSYASRGDDYSNDYSYGGDSDQGTVRGGGDGDDNGGTNGGGNGNGNGNKEKSGAEDTSWRNIDYRDPNADPSLYPSRPAPRPTPAAPQRDPQPQPQQGASNGATPSEPAAQQVSTRFDPQRGYTNNLDSEHANLPGPKASVREYIAGRDAMKDKIKADLKTGGVCGLAQALFSVTLDPQGKVVDYDVLGANSDAVELQLMTVLPTLQFQPAQVNYNQELYLEFKAEIVCEGGDRVNLRNVTPILEAGNN